MADGRIPLKRGWILQFPGMECEVEDYIGMGSDAFVYLGSYSDNHSNKKHRVLIKELFPYQVNGAIYRDDNGTVQIKTEAVDLFELHKRSFLRAIDIHLSLLAMMPQKIDGSINSYSCNGTLYSILDYTGGNTLENVLSSHPETSLKTHVERLLKVLSVLSGFHDNGLLHLDISPDNILLIGSENERVTLIDYNSVHSLDEVGKGDGIYYSTKAGFSSPEVLSGRYSEIGVAADLYSLTAVFYYCITGKRLTEFQALCSTPPDVSKAKCLEGLSDPVVSEVKKILKKGLNPSIARRYNDASEMKRDFIELLDRINGRGITHWALWESGRNQAVKVIRNNPALSYVKDDNSIYPMYISGPNGEKLSFDEFVSHTLQTRKEPLYLTGNGGVGKTTILLRIAATQSSRYSDTSTVFSYISLYGWNSSGGDGIKNRLLESLHFKNETRSFEDARHELIHLLREPIHTRSADKPKLVILLDGWNEISCGEQELIREIGELNSLDGVRIVISGRSKPVSMSVALYTAECLPVDTVAEILSSHGILPPENCSVMELIRTPIMLSAFIKTADANDCQPTFSSDGELLDGYIRSLCGHNTDKDEKDEKDAEYYMVSAATEYVLTEIAKKESGVGRALSDTELFKIVKNCYGSLKTRDITAVFPEWIGHIADIKGETKNADDWYGKVIKDILWRRLGLLIQNEDGCYRIFHQHIRDYLAKKSENIGGRIRKRKMIRHSVLAVFLCLIMGTAVYGLSIFSPLGKSEPEKEPYNKEYAERIVSDVFSVYTDSAFLYENMTECLSLAGSDLQKYEIAYRKCAEELANPSIRVSGSASVKVEALLSSGEVMPWSKQPLNKDTYFEFLETVSERRKDYSEYLKALDWLAKDESRWSELGEKFRTDLQAVLDADAELTGNYYQILLYPELNGMENGDSTDRQERKKLVDVIMSHESFYLFTKNAEDDIFTGKTTNSRIELRTHPVFSLFDDEY